MAEYRYIDTDSVVKILALIKEMGAKKLEVEKVSTLPTTPKEKTLYLVQENTVDGIALSKTYIYLNGWVCIGNADLNVQVKTMPTPSIKNVNKIVQYVGTTTDEYKRGQFYECVEEDGMYSWRKLTGFGEGASTNIIADDFDGMKDYLEGEYVIHEGDLYKCISNHTAGAWNDSEFEKTNVTDNLGGEGGSGLTADELSNLLSLLD